ncbi:DsrE family protein [Sphaerochaeta sp. PS]|uniref:DsrE family protein n=1 Tax=Sphaerochaeta sp. PS TaxID=3076336 RepID=UPI0028A4A747|nr:DsrE family protein [Sphaerochaeta sp. PS]MDT4761335.1 DsrE family protein [Sphaerochaeta sp. PS]
MDKFVIFAFQGNPTCFVHVLLNALDMHAKGKDVKVVLEGEAVKLVKAMTEAKNPLFRKVVELKLIDSVCRACSATLGVLEYNEQSGLPVGGDMSNHPSFLSYIEKGYQVITL